ncbi:MAG: hypothetical protein VW625_10440 [Perlucidibaca sp.]
MAGPALRRWCLAGLLLLPALSRAEIAYLWTVTESAGGISTSRIPFVSLDACLRALPTLPAASAVAHDRYCAVSGESADGGSGPASPDGLARDVTPVP